MPTRKILILLVFTFVSIIAYAGEKAAPISLHPDNPRYLSWRGKPTVLITSAEHYGAVMNAPFDYIAYLDELHSAGLNLTRIFSGVYCEADGDFEIANNTLAPGLGNLLTPFARSDKPGYANGGNKFDLTKWDDAYFARLKDFVAQADKRGIAVEFTFFCPYYHRTQWALSPFNPENNINDIDLKVVAKGKGLGRFGHAVISDPKLLTVQQALVRKVVMELKDADNLYYEVCNEAYRVDIEWQHKIAQMIVDAEKDFPRKHLIAQNIRDVYKSVHPAVSIYNYHPGAVNTSVRGNYGLNKLNGLDETSPKPLPGMPRGTAQSAFDYRRWGWTHLLDGGAIYNNLDYSFTVEDPKGRKSWGQDEKMAKVRKQLQILKDFIEGFDFVHMKPDTTHVSWSGSSGSVEAVHVLSKQGEAYAIYLYGGTRAVLTLNLPAGQYRAEWVNTLSGKVDKADDITHRGGTLELASPMYKDDVALRLNAVSTASLLAKTTIGAPETSERPNILWITCEDISVNFGCYGDAYARTPNLDKLASEGILYTKVYATAPTCSPARSSIITGVHACSLGTQHLRSIIGKPGEIRCFTEYLREAGYYCTNNYKQDYNFRTPENAWDESSRSAHWMEEAA